MLGNTVGVKVTGPNGNHIFLSAAGYISVLVLNSQGSTGYYWSGTRSDALGGGAFYLYIVSSLLILLKKTGNGHTEMDMLEIIT